MRRYYPTRLFTYAFWLKLAKFEVNIKSACIELTRFLRQQRTNPGQQKESPDFTGRMLEGMQRFGGETLIILSGKEDLTAQIFKALVDSDPQWRSACHGSRATCKTLHDADHTFSRNEWRDQVGVWTINWIKSMFQNINQ